MRSIANAVLISIVLLYSVSAFAAKETYRAQLRLATHRGQAYDANTWDAKVIWYATFVNDVFRRAFAKKYAEVNHMGPLEAAQWMEDQQSLQQRQWNVFISMFTKKDYKKFSLDSDTFWEIYMTTANSEAVWPTSIEQVPITPLVQVLYPHINRWSKLYMVTFPKVPVGEELSLTLQSVVGESQLKWTKPN